MYSKSSDLNERYLREINDNKQLITNLEQKVAKLEEERGTLQLAARLIAQDKYCRNVNTSFRWQNVSKSNTTDRDFTNRVQLQNTSDSYLRNRYELLIDEGDYNGSNEPRNIHESFQNQSHPINYSEQTSENHNNEPEKPQHQHQRQDNPRQNTEKQQSRLLAFPCDENAEYDLNQPEQDIESNRQPADTQQTQTMQPSGKRYSGNDQSKNHKPVILIGDSIIKHIDPKKLSRKTVYKYTYPDKTCEEINKAVGDMHTKLDPSHVIVHCGTNNLVIDSADVCVTKIKDLAENIQSKFPNAKLGISGLTYREDVKINHIRLDVNEKLMKLCSDNNFAYIDNTAIDKTCLNGSKLHLNNKGSTLLAVRFIKFLRPQSGSNRHDRSGHQGFQMALLKQLGGMLMMMGNKKRT